MTYPVTDGRRRRLRAAAVLQIVQGALMECSVLVALVVVSALGLDLSRSGEYFSFIVPYLQDNLELMMVMSGIFGVLRIVGAVALWRNRMWGLGLSLIMCVVTIALMIFLLPAGIVDGLLSGTALVLILQAWLGNDPVVPDVTEPAGVRSGP
ncbi:hypothetical protein [Occultella gossypii]|uniref:DUF2127 domain-containing protein n=1 Tax=Occultella gossypii TaxID=2800820 RepID=A0ABS7SC74_9MICO|nr:hypothetical protein [Occultella gossypii]MBZ2197957.1 hypothetical protein [Occultella gossypii]